MSGLDENKTKLDMIRDVITNTSWVLTTDSAYAYNLGIETEDKKTVDKIRNLMDALFKRKLVRYSSSVDFKLYGSDESYKLWTYRNGTRNVWGIHVPYMSIERLEYVVKLFNLQIDCGLLDARIAKFSANLDRFLDYERRLTNSKGR